jgi:predicted peptidase
MRLTLVKALAWLLVLSGAISTPLRSYARDEGTPGKQREMHFSGSDAAKLPLDYLLYLPEGYATGGKEWPLVLFLHGAGETGSDLKRVKVHGPPHLAEQKKFPFILVSPQCPQRGWNISALNALLDHVIAGHRVDKNRVYVTGLSMGGFGTWALASTYPERFAAIIPICGGGNPANASKLKELPIWVFHGAKDETVPPSRSEDMVKALKSAGAERVKFTLYPNAKHDSWTVTYNNAEVWDWLLKQKRNSPK